MLEVVFGCSDSIVVETMKDGTENIAAGEEPIA
jgi:hypothetical protein